MTVLVIGANGYLGRNLALQLRADGHRVRGCDLQPDGAIRDIPYRALDVTQGEQWAGVDTEVDVVLFFAGLTGTHRGFSEYARYLLVNEMGLLHLLDLLRARGQRPRVVFPSSRLVYRGSPEPLSEEAAKESKTVYAANKLAAEGFLQAYHAAFAIPYTIVRIGVPYGNLGEGSYSFGTIGAFIRMAREKKVIPLFGDGSPRRTFSHVQDIGRQVGECMGLAGAVAQAYNLAGETLSLLQVAGRIARRFGASVRHVPWPAPELAIESGDTVFDDSKIRHLLDFTPSHSFHEWIEAADPDEGPVS